MLDWIGDAQTALSLGPTAMVSILATEGSAPRGAGTRMIVTNAACHGTIGGGQLEFQAIAQARMILGEMSGAWRVQDYPLGPLLGQCCGGRVRLLVEHLRIEGTAWLHNAAHGTTLSSRFRADHIDRTILKENLPPSTLSARDAKPAVGFVIAERLGHHKRPVYLFGAGHVGQAIAKIAGGLPFSLAWFDSRRDMTHIDGVSHVEARDLPSCLDRATTDAAVLILTHDHGLDYELTVAALSSKAVFVGLIGSATKRARFTARLARDGIDTSRLTCPIGVPGILGKEPDIIAVAAIAQLLQLGELAHAP